MLRLRVKKDSSGFVVRAYDGSRRVGILATVFFGGYNDIWTTEVAPAYRRRGIGTMMYLEAAAQGCLQGKKLRSPQFARSRDAHALWQSLLRSGIATELVNGDIVIWCRPR